VNGVYAFGFLFMLPQLFVNYRLKSVAHLPFKAFMYKVILSMKKMLHFKLTIIETIYDACKNNSKDFIALSVAVQIENSGN
jgi:predicted transcriptional regulator